MALVDAAPLGVLVIAVVGAGAAGSIVPSLTVGASKVADTLLALSDDVLDDLW